MLTKAKNQQNINVLEQSFKKFYNHDVSLFHYRDAQTNENKAKQNLKCIL